MTEHNLPNEDDAPWLDCMDGFKQLTKQQVDGVFSPAAQEVFCAFNSKFDWIEDGVPGPQFKAIAAALRAAAIDQNKQIDVPFSKIDQWEKIIGSTLSYWTAAQWGYQKAMSELLAIAAELEELPND